ncbi:MAG TPA: DNA primase [Candidatus Polarisedimenticolaceae bacterium]|nr:DNA primase [Candidatus Polarisedimenticolaceae bacterium]
MAVPLTREFVAAVRNAGDIVRLVSDYVPLKPGGARLKGLCPFHHEKTPSFSVDPQMQLFYCFGCHAGGDAFKFVMLYEKLEFPEAVEFLANRWGIPLPSAAHRPEDDARRRVLLMNEAAAGFFRAQWRDGARGQTARAYLAKRGISEETADRFEIGYAPDTWDSLGNILGARGFTDQEILSAGLAVARKEGTGHYDRFRHRLIFPIRDAAGHVVAFGGRALGDAEPKYLNSPETPAYVKGEHLYGLDVAREPIRREGFAILVEGYLDLIALHQAGFDNAVASLGTALTPAQVKLLSRSTERVVVSYDGDAAGANATVKSLDLFLERGFDVRVAEVPDGKDPDDFVKEFGRAAYEAVVRDAPDYLEYLVRRERRGRDLARPGEKVAAINAILPRLARLDNAVERASWAGRLADALDIEDDLVMQELRGALKVAKGAIRHRVAGDDAATPVEARLVRLLLGSDEARAHARKVVDPADLEAAARVAPIVRTILDLDAQGLPVNGPLVVDALSDENDRTLLTRIAFRDDPPGGPEEVDGCLDSLRSHRLKKQLKESGRDLASLQKEEETKRLLERMNLGRQLDAPYRDVTH